MITQNKWISDLSKLTTAGVSLGVNVGRELCKGLSFGVGQLASRLDLVRRNELHTYHMQLQSARLEQEALKKTIAQLEEKVSTLEENSKVEPK